MVDALHDLRCRCCDVHGRRCRIVVACISAVLQQITDSVEFVGVLSHGARADPAQSPLNPLPHWLFMCAVHPLRQRATAAHGDEKKGTHFSACFYIWSSEEGPTPGTSASPCHRWVVIGTSWSGDETKAGVHSMFSVTTFTKELPSGVPAGATEADACRHASGNSHVRLVHRCCPDPTPSRSSLMPPGLPNLWAGQPFQGHLIHPCPMIGIL